MVFTQANLQFRDDAYKTIISTIITSGNYQFPGRGYWVTNNSYANDMRQYWGGWWVAHFYNNNIVNIGFNSFTGITGIPTEEQILSVVNPSTFTWTGNLQSNSDMACFLEGSKILTDKGYIPIQDLRKGDLVKTLKHDYKAIDMIGKREIYYSALQERINNQLYKCSQNEYPEIFEPLIITGSHCILVDKFTCEEQKEKVIEVNGEIYVTDNKYRLPACADLRASVYEIPGIYAIYHLALENDDKYMNYGIYANGLLVETCSKRYLKELSNMSLIE
jgi:hypothetical protein